MSFHERMRTLRVLVEELSDKLGDVLCSIAFGSFIRGRMDFKDVDLFILTRTEHYIENSLITNSLTVEIHLMSLKELEALKNEKILYGIWRDGFLLNGDPTPIFHKLKSFLKKHGWKVDNLRIERARLGLEDARRKLEEYKRARTDVERAYHLSTACEHAFHSAVTALEELLIKEKYPIPSNHGERFRLLEELSKKKSKIAKLKLKERLGSLFTDLHVRGYYRSTLNIEEAEKCIRKVERYVRDIEELLDDQ